MDPLPQDSAPPDSPVDDFESGGAATQDASQPLDTGSGLPPASSGASDGLRSVRDVILSMGYTPSATDDYGAVQELARLAQEAQQLRDRVQAMDFHARLGQTVAQLPPDRLQQLNQPAAPQRQPWEPPPFQEDWMQLVDQDPASGKYVAKAGVPPEIGRHVNEYQDYVRGFMRNPATMITQAAEHVAKQQFGQLFEQEWARRQSQQEAASIMRDNATWLYQYDSSGQVMRDLQGRPSLSRNGTLYAQAVRQLSGAGVTDPSAQNRLAIQIVQGQLASEQTTAANVSQQTRQAQNQALPSSRPNINPLQALSADERAATAGATDNSFGGLSFRERALAAMRAEGITDADFTPDAFGP